MNIYERRKKKKEYFERKVCICISHGKSNERKSLNINLSYEAA